jgi:hypothetical protein
LKKSNNNTYDFFKQVREKVELSKSNGDLKEVLDSMRSIGSISQYGNLNHSQDLMLEELLKEVKIVLDKL